MTREELREHCKKQIKMCEVWAEARGENPCGKVYEEHKLILELLEQAPYEDAISRQAAIDALWKVLYEYENKTEKQFIDSEELDIADWFQHRVFVQNMSDIDRQTILNMPSVTPQPKIGRWMFIQTIFDEHGYTAECPFCHKKWKTYDEIRFEKEHNFCPNCGAKMEVYKNDD